MAKITTIFDVQGTLHNVTFCKTKHGLVAKRKTSLAKDRLMNSPEFARTRENMSEFKSAAQAGKMLRDALRPLLASVASKNLTPRMMKLIRAGLKFDTTSVRGQRQPQTGLTSTQGKASVKGFNFNDGVLLGSVLFKTITINATTGAIALGSLVPMTDLAYPTDATHVKFNAGVMVINLQSGVFDLKQAPELLLPINTTSTAVTLTPTALPTGTGLKLYLLKVEFVQQLNGVNYPLKNGAYNAMTVIEVA